MGKDFDQALRDVVKGAGVVYLGLIINYVTAFLAQVLAANFLGVGEFGNIITGTAVLDVGAIVATLGINIGLARNLPREESTAERLQLANAAFLVAVPLSIVVGAAIALNGEFIASEIFGDSDVAISMWVFGATVPFAVVFNLTTGGIRGQEMPKYRVYLRNILQPVSRMVLVIAAVVLGLDVIGYLGAYSLPYVLVALGGVVLFARSLSGFRVIGATDLGTVSDLLRFSLPLTVSNAMGFLIRSSDIFIVLFFLDNEAVGVYGVVYALARIILMFSTAFNYLGMPVASALESDDKNDEAIRINESILRWLGILSVPVLFPLVVYPSPIIAFVYRPDYASGWLALGILATGFAVHNVLSANRNLLTALGHTKIIMANNIITGTLNLLLNITLIPLYGITGAAIATAASYVLRDLIVILELKYLTGKLTTTRRVLTPLAIAAPVVAVGQVVSTFLPVSIVVVVFLTAILGLAYFALIVALFGFTSEEVMLIRSAEEKYGLPLGPFDRIIDRLDDS